MAIAIKDRSQVEYLPNEVPNIFNDHFTLTKCHP